MAEEVIDSLIERNVGDIGINEWQRGLANAINDTFSYKNNSTFFACMPAYYKDYAWKYIRVACQWLDGYVWSLHSGTSGIISTRIATKLITGLTKQIVGEKLVFKLASKKTNEAMDTLKFVSEWAKRTNLIKAVYAGIGFSLGVGTSLLKMNIKNMQEIWWEAVRLDNCFYLSSFSNEIEDATFLIRGYTDTRQGKNNQQFFLVEHRYYETYDGSIKQNPDGSYSKVHKKGDRVAMVEYKVLRVNGTINNNTMAQSANSPSVNWEEIPTDIRRMIKRDFSAYRIGEPMELGLTDLGVVALLNGEIDLAVPTATNFGESMLIGVQDDLITYEVAASYLIRDMYLGKGTVYVPKSLSLSDYQNGVMPTDNILGGIGEGKYETIKGVSPEEQSIVVQQFNLRAQEWQLIKDNAVRGVAVKWGMSPKILSSYLAQGTAQMTATQVDSEDDLSIAFIYHTRSYFKNDLNKLLEATLNFYGKPANVELDFASPSLVNKDRLLNRVTGQLEAGLIDIEEAIRTTNPDLDEEALQDKIDRANQRQQEMMMSQLNEMNSMGGFGDEE